MVALLPILTTTLSKLRIFMSALMFYLFIFDTFYNKEFIQYLLLVCVEVVLVYFSMPGPDRYFIYPELFKVYVSKVVVKIGRRATI